MEETIQPRGNFLAGRGKFFIGGVLILAAVVYLIFTSSKANAQFFLTIKELQARGPVQGNDVRVSGAVIGDSIQYDSKTLTLKFTVADVPADMKEVDAQGGLAAVLHAAVIDPNRPRLNVSYTGPKPDLMRDEAQAIMTGHLGTDGVFYANELLLKCPTKYEEAVPGKTGTSQ